MSNIQVISRERHAGLRWKRFTSYAFAADHALQPLLVAELPKAAMSLPIAFVEQDGAYLPVAVLGLAPGNNLFVAPDGRWVGAYAPAAFRSYPFRLGQTATGQQALCIDEDSGLVGEGPEGERFFADDGTPDQPIVELLGFLSEIERSRVATVAACAALRTHGVIAPWSISVKNAAGEEQPVGGLFKIDEAALRDLSAEALHAVSKSAGLGMAYCQLLSMQHLPLLGQLAGARARALEAAQQQAKQVQQPAAKDLNLDFLKNETLNFSAF